MFALYFLKLTLAHLLVRFTVEPYLSTNAPPIPLGNIVGRLAAPGAKAMIAALLLSQQLHPQMLLTLGVFTVCGAAIDLLERNFIRPAWAWFAVAQGAYVVLCAGIALWWSAAGNVAMIVNGVSAVPSDRRVLWISTVYFATIFGGGALVQTITAHFRQQFDQEHSSKKPGLEDAGKCIGWLERLLIVTFVLGGFGDAIGFLLAAKTLVRYPEIRDDKGIFAEYFLIGTLTSVGLALLAGFILRWAVA